MNDFKPWSEFDAFQDKLLKEINEGVDIANEYFKANNIKAKSYKPINVTIERNKPL